MNRVVAFALKQQALMAALFAFVCVAGLVSFLRLEHRGLSGPGPAPRRHRRAERGPIRRGDGALRHHSARNPDGGDSACFGDPDDLAVRPFRRQIAVHLRRDLRGGGADGDRSARPAVVAALRRQAADFALEPDRRNLPIPRRRTEGLFGDRPQDDRGLAARTALQGGARRRGRERLGRQEQDL